jgi:chromosome segregation ATPase
VTIDPAILTTGGAGAVVAGILTFLVRHKYGRGILLKFLEQDGLNEKIQGAVNTAVSALEAALRVRSEELQRVEEELAELRYEVRELRNADDRKNMRIAELESEVVRLSAENEALKEELKRRRGGRPKRSSDEVSD